MPESDREVELIRRLASARATAVRLGQILDEIVDELPETLDGVGGLLSALGHDLDGTPGCLDEEEWETKRRAHVIAYLSAASVAPLPEPGGYRRIAGQCPMGCGETLISGEGGHITCTHLDCSNPAAVDEMLSPAAEAQRQEEDTERMRWLEKLAKRNQVMSDAVAVLLDELGDQWWLRAAAAFNELTTLVVEPRDL